MSQLNPNYYANGIMNEQQFNQISQALYSYCKVMRVPKMGPVPALITVLEGVAITLLTAALGVSILTAVVAGVIVAAVFAFLFWLAYRYRVGASKRLNSFLAEDGGRMMISDFAAAQPFVNDQFRLGRYYLFIKKGAVLRRDSIIDIVRIPCRSGVGLSVTVNDVNGSVSFPLCRLHVIGAGTAEADEIRKAVMQGHLPA